MHIALWCLAVYLVIGLVWGGIMSLIAHGQDEHVTLLDFAKTGAAWPVWIVRIVVGR